MSAQVRLHYPCQLERNSENFSAVDGAAYCHQCERLVVDFTKYSDEELIVFLKENAGKNHCGLFRAEQVNKKQAFWQQFRLEFRAAAALLLTVASVKTGLAGNLDKAARNNTPAATVTQTIKGDSIDYHIKGTIADTKIHYKVGYVTITAYLAGTGTVVGQTITDGSGNFEIIFHAAAGDTFDLRFERYRYHTRTVRDIIPSTALLEVELKHKSNLIRRIRRIGHGHRMGKF